MKWDSGPIFDLHDRSTWIVLVGYGIALAVAVVLLVGQSRDMASAKRFQEQQNREREERRRMLNDPNVQRRMEALRQERARQKPE